MKVGGYVGFEVRMIRMMSVEEMVPDFTMERGRRYEFVRKIGAGAFGEVSAVRDGLTGELLAAKKVRLKSGPSYGYGQPVTFPQPLYREIQALQRLTHPNIVALRDVYPVDSEVVLVFELCPSDLELVIDKARAPLAERHVKAFMVMLLRAIAFMHSRRILHRDVKPANCLISASGALKLCDFGLARPFPLTSGEAASGGGGGGEDSRKSKVGMDVGMEGAGGRNPGEIRGDLSHQVRLAQQQANSNRQLR